MGERQLTGGDNYFEDFVPGDVFRHARGKTVGEIDNTLITNLVMNTADIHFNDFRMAQEREGRRLVFGGATIALVIGLATQDTGEHALDEIGLDELRLSAGVFEGDTLYAFSEVVSVDSDRDDSGVVTFRHRGVNQRAQLVFEGLRTARIAKRPAALRESVG